MAERLAQTEQLVAQLKELIREKDAALCSKDEQLKVSRQPLQWESVDRTPRVSLRNSSSRFSVAVWP